MTRFRSFVAACALLTAGAAHASLVTNGSFETGLTGWACVAGGGNCFAGTQSGVTPVDGSSYFYGFDNVSPAGVLSQSLATVAGASYSISFAFNTNGAAPPNALSVIAGDLDQDLPVVQFAWGTYSSTFTAAGASTLLQFIFSTAGGSGTVFLDNVIVDRVGTVPVPPTLALVALGIAGLAATRRRQR